jgi:hypothetical protein
MEVAAGPLAEASAGVAAAAFSPTCGPECYDVAIVPVSLPACPEICFAVLTYVDFVPPLAAVAFPCFRRCMPRVCSSNSSIARTS